MKLQGRLAQTTVLLVCLLVGSATMAVAQRGPEPDPIQFLKHALNEADAPALSSDQETQIKTLITNLRSSLPDGPDDALKAAHEAFDAAVLAGDLAAAQAQATIIANRTSALATSRLQASAKFDIDVLAVLKSGGQLDALKQKFGDRLVGLLGALAGPHLIFGGPGFARTGGPGFGPMGPPPGGRFNQK